MKNDVSQLAAKAKKRDPSAFAALYDLYSADLYRFALYYTRDPFDAEDAVQEAALAAYGSITKLKDPEAFRSWFFKILANVCKGMLSRKAKHPFIPQDSLPEPQSEADPSVLSPEMKQALGLLSDEDRSIVLLSVLERYTSAEISEMMDIPAGTVRSRLSRALARLRKYFTEE